MKSDILLYDVEVAPNRSMVGFMDYVTNEVTQFEHNESRAIAKFIKGKTLIGFNSKKYDNIILTAMIGEKSAKDIYLISVDIIEHGANYWDFQNVIRNDIDLIEVAIGQASLKLYGSRLNTKYLQDLPFNPHTKHSKEMWRKVKKYNVNDLLITKELYDFLQPQLNIRKQIGQIYNIDVMSRSDAQIAEDIFKKELKIVKRDIKIVKPTNVVWDKPDWIKFKNKSLSELSTTLSEIAIKINPKSGQPILPDMLKDARITINKGVYTVGIGGLHSNEKSVAHHGELGNVDVASYYPSIIINSKLYPPQLGEKWLNVYTRIRNDRFLAKTSGDEVKSHVLKIVLNGTYGKLGSQYSFLYAPNLLINVTMTGQFALLMLIEKIENKGIQVVSANTDGIEILYKSERDKKVVKRIVSRWEITTGYTMEYGYYKGLYSRDVNSYVAVYDGYVKAKGFYGEPSINKNIEYPIVTEAIRKYLLDGTNMADTIRGCTEPSKFCVARTVNGGAIWSPKTYPNSDEFEKFIVEFNAGKRKDNKALRKRNEKYQRNFVVADADKYYIGKVVRYYYSREGKAMYTNKSGNQVPKTEGCKPMMEMLTELPHDLDYDKYILLAHTHLMELGVEK